MCSSLLFLRAKLPGMSGMAHATNLLIALIVNWKTKTKANRPVMTSQCCLVYGSSSVLARYPIYLEDNIAEISAPKYKQLTLGIKHYHVIRILPASILPRYICFVVVIWFGRLAKVAGVKIR